MEQVKSFLVIYTKANGANGKSTHVTLDKAMAAFKRSKAKYAAVWLVAGGRVLDSFER